MRIEKEMRVLLENELWCVKSICIFPVHTHTPTGASSVPSGRSTLTRGRRCRAPVLPGPCWSQLRSRQFATLLLGRMPVVYAS